jgi:hypothetical protein
MHSLAVVAHDHQEFAGCTALHVSTGRVGPGGYRTAYRDVAAFGKLHSIAA